LRYFPWGYGDALRQKPEQTLDLVRVILGQLDEEPDPWLRSHRVRLAEAYDGFRTAQDGCVASLAARADASAYLVAEKRRWIRGLAASRLRAKAVCSEDEGYLRMIYAPADVRRRVITVVPEIEVMPVGAMVPEVKAEPVATALAADRAEPAPRLGRSSSSVREAPARAPG
jgi:hypothetical protein